MSINIIKSFHTPSIVILHKRQPSTHSGSSSWDFRIYSFSIKFSNFFFYQLQYCRRAIIWRPSVVLAKQHAAACAGRSGHAGRNTLWPVQRPRRSYGEEERHWEEGQSHAEKQEGGFKTAKEESRRKQRCFSLFGPDGWTGLHPGLQFESTNSTINILTITF